MEIEDAVADRLIAAGVCVAIGTDLFVNKKARLPTGDTPFISVVSYGGGLSRTHSTDYGEPVVQVVAHGLKEAAVKTKARQAFSALAGIYNTTVGADFYQWIRAASDPFELPEDGQGRARRAFNVEAMKSQP